jgi:carbonic anhydrase/acetyltransferase-like protein (isoleucine patch superfamily)
VIYELGDRRPVLEGSGHFVAESAALIGQVRLGSEASVWFGCVLRGDNDWIEVGERSNVQDGSVLHTDVGCPLTIGPGVTVGHQAVLHGCTIEADTLIGIGSVILNGAVIPGNCIVGAGALVTEGKTYPEGSLILGAPARVARALTDAEIESIRHSADHYVENAKRYTTALRST